MIRDPKVRVITAPCFEERVLHHAIMNVCEPVLDSWLIDDTFACRNGKGREAAILCAQQYFDSISHQRLLHLLEVDSKKQDCCGFYYTTCAQSSFYLYSKNLRNSASSSSRRLGSKKSSAK